MKLGWNLAAGLANSVWTALVSLAAVPFYLHYIGVEAYGLIGFFTAMQAVFVLLDLGFSLTLNREVARSQELEARARAGDLLRTLSLIYWSIGALVAFVCVAGAHAVATHWLSSTTLSKDAVAQALMLMGLVIACRIPHGPYLGAVMGAQRMGLASGIEIANVSLSHIGGVAVLALVSPSLDVYFVWQALVASLNVIAIRQAAWRALDVNPVNARFDLAALKQVWGFSGGMALTALLGTIYLQADKLVLGKMVGLQELGQYTLAGVAARSLYVFLAPTFSAVYPRLTALYAAGDEQGLATMYRTGTRLLMSVVWPAAIFIALYTQEIFRLWTGNATVAAIVPPVVAVLLLGTACNGAMHFPYALQLASGRSSLGAKINLGLLVPYLITLVVCSAMWGMFGAAFAWAAYNLAYLIAGVTGTHRVLLRGLGWRWLISDVGVPLVVALAVAGGGAKWARSLGLHDLAELMLGAAFAGTAVLLSVALSPAVRRDAKRLLAISMAR